jgi:ABC-type bacteriocin/lantibiotic exporter with double-glycine peptidase domain
MKKNKLKGTFTNRAGLLCLGWATIQQVIVAASTYLIIEAIRLTTENRPEKSVYYLVGFAASLVIVYLPNTLSLMYLQKWRLASFSNFLRLFIEKNSGRTSWAHSRDKSQYESWLTNESTNIYDQCTNLIYQLYSTLLSTVLNVLVISTAIDQRIFGWYLIAGLILLLMVRLFEGKIAESSLDAQETRKNLANLMLSGWDNVFIGNTHTLTNWISHFNATLTAAEGSAVRYDVTRSGVSSLTVSFALIIISTGNAIFYLENRTNLASIAALCITLPRQLQIVQNIFLFFNVFLSWKGAAQQLEKLAAVIYVAQSDRDLTRFIQMDHITFSKGGDSKQFPSLEDLRLELAASNRGRVTIRGRNGAGKSTLLALLSEKLGEKSFYLPSHSIDLKFSDQSIRVQSEGNRVVSIFRELSQLTDIPYLLLDEWDANLDGENLELVDRLIDQLAHGRLILESRHRV